MGDTALEIVALGSNVKLTMLIRFPHTALDVVVMFATLSPSHLSCTSL